MTFMQRLKANPILAILCIAALVYMAVLVYFIFLEQRYGDLDGMPATRFPVHAGDSAGYSRIAENLMRAGAFSVSAEPPFVPDSFRTPAYPFLVAMMRLLFGSDLALSLLQIIFALLTGMLIFKMGEKLISRNGGMAAAFLYLFDPTTIFHSILILTDTLFVFLVVLAVYLLFFSEAESVRRPFAMPFAAGVVLGGAILVRPIGAFLPLLLAFFYAIVYVREYGWRRCTAKVLLFLIISLTVVAPWAVRNKMVFDTWGLSAVGSYVLFKGNLSEFLKFQRGFTAEEARLELQKFGAPIGYEFSSIKHSAYLQSVFLTHVLEDPLSYLKFHLVKTIPFFLTSGLRNVIEFVPALGKSLLVPGGKPNFTSLILGGEFGELLRALSREWIFTLENLFWFVITLLAFSGIVVRGVRRPILVLFFIIVLGFAFLTGAVANARYRLPAEPFLLLLAVTGFTILKSGLGRFTYQHLRVRKS